MKTKEYVILWRKVYGKPRLEPHMMTANRADYLLTRERGPRRVTWHRSFEEGKAQMRKGILNIIARYQSYIDSAHLDLAKVDAMQEPSVTMESENEKISD